MSEQNPINKAINSIFSGIYFADHLGDVNREVHFLFELQELITQVKNGELSLEDFDVDGIDKMLLNDYNLINTGGYLCYEDITDSSSEDEE